MELPDPHYKQPIPPQAKQVFKGEIFDVYQWEQKMFDGSTAIFEKLKRPATATVIPVLPDGTILISEQEQPNKPLYLGFLGGRVDPGETPFDAAKRELLEESGYTSDDWSLLSVNQPIGKIDWLTYTFIARNCQKTAEQELDGGEKITLRTVSFEEFIELTAHGELDEPKLQIAVLKAKLDPLAMTELKKKILG